MMKELISGLAGVCFGLGRRTLFFVVVAPDKFEFLSPTAFFGRDFNTAGTFPRMIDTVFMVREEILPETGEPVPTCFNQGADFFHMFPFSFR